MKKLTFVILIVTLLSVTGFAQTNDPEVTYVGLLSGKAGNDPLFFRLQGWNLTGGYSYAFYPVQDNGSPKEYPVDGLFAERVNMGSEQLYIVYEPAQTLPPGMYTLVIKSGEKVISPSNQHTLHLGIVHQVVPLKASPGTGPFEFVLEGEELKGGYDYAIHRVKDDGNADLCNGQFTEAPGSDSNTLIVTFQPDAGLVEGKYTLTVSTELGGYTKTITQSGFHFTRSLVEEVTFEAVPDYAYIRYTLRGKNLTGGYTYEIRCLDGKLQTAGSLPGQFIEEVLAPGFITLVFIPDQSSFVEASYKLSIYQNTGTGQREEISPHNSSLIQRADIEGKAYGEK